MDRDETALVILNALLARSGNNFDMKMVEYTTSEDGLHTVTKETGQTYGKFIVEECFKFADEFLSKTDNESF